VNGHAFSNFERSTVVLQNVPGVAQDVALGTEIADGSGSWRIADGTHGGSISCSTAQARQLVTVQATDLETGKIATATFPGSFFCNNATSSANFNGGCVTGP
jgi:hypothetical protein